MQPLPFAKDLSGALTLGRERDILAAMKRMTKEITKPTLLVDQEIVSNNIKKIAEKCVRQHVRLKPHFKTHQSAEVGDMFREFGISGITVSSVSMASYFAEEGWEDITVAFPVNRLEIDAINRLAKKAKLHLLVEAEESVRFLDERLEGGVDIWIEVDTGYHRSGIPDSEKREIAAVARAIVSSTKLRLRGLLTHAGHSYNARGKDELEAVFRDTADRMAAIELALREQGIAKVEISVGDTPTCSIVEDFSGVDEIRCGNFVYYDLMQYFIGSCRLEEIAVALACPVVGIYPRRGEFVLYGGAVHLSKEHCVGTQGQKIFGYVCTLTEAGWEMPLPDTYVSSLSQEHGIVKAPPGVLDNLRRGDLLAVLPVHSCLAANLMKEETRLIQSLTH